MSDTASIRRWPSRDPLALPPGPPPRPWWLELNRSAGGEISYATKPREAAAIYWMLSARDLGLTYGMIVGQMPERYRGLKNDAWDSSTVGSLLRNPAIKGAIIWNDKKFIVPTVDPEKVFDRVQESGFSRQRNGYAEDNVNWFVHKARCEACGEFMGIRERGRVLVCTNRRDKCPARYKPWPIADFKKSCAFVIGEIGRRELYIKLKAIELTVAKFELKLWREKKRKTSSNQPQKPQIDKEIEQLQILLAQLAAQIRALKTAKRQSGRYIMMGDHVEQLTLDRQLNWANLRHIEKLVHDIYVAPVGTKPGLEVRRDLAARAKVSSNFGFDLVRGTERLAGERLFRVRLKDGEQVDCWVDKGNPAEVACHFTEWQPDGPQYGETNKDHLLLAVEPPPGKDFLDFRIEIRQKQ